LKVAKEDAYDSVLALLNARSNAYNSLAAANRMLLDHDHATEHAKNFKESVSAVATFDGDHNFAETIARAESELKKSDKLNLAGFNGALSKELSNVRFPREGEAALKALKTFADYFDGASQVQDLEKSGAHADAVHKSLSYAPTGAKYPFTKFDDALLDTLNINQVQMDSKVKEAFADLDGLVMQTEAVCLLAVICIYFALLPRMEEYFHCEPRSAHDANKP
jgi:hypothetical protein